MDNMTLTDLEVSLKNFMPEPVEIITDDEGQVVIYTGLKIGDNNELIPIEE